MQQLISRILSRVFLALWHLHHKYPDSRLHQQTSLSNRDKMLQINWDLICGAHARSVNCRLGLTVFDPSHAITSFILCTSSWKWQNDPERCTTKMVIRSLRKFSHSDILHLAGRFWFPCPKHPRKVRGLFSAFYFLAGNQLYDCLFSTSTFRKMFC